MPRTRRRAQEELPAPDMDAIEPEKKEEKEESSGTEEKSGLPIPEILSREIAKRTNSKRTKRSRSPYKCKYCGKPKRGHVCDIPPPTNIKSSLPGVAQQFSTFSSTEFTFQKNKQNKTTPVKSGETNSQEGSDNEDTESQPKKIEFSMASFGVAVSSLDLLHSNLKFQMEKIPDLAGNQSLHDLLGYLEKEKEYLDGIKTTFQMQFTGHDKVQLKNHACIQVVGQRAELPINW